MKSGGRWTTGCLAKLAGDAAAYDAVLATVPRSTAPKRIADFGYEYTDDGKLVQSRTKQPFAWLGQKHYDALGDAIVNDIYAMMEERYGLKRIQIPMTPVDPATAGAASSASPERDTEDPSLAEHHAHGPRPTVPVFVSPNYLDAEVLVLLCQGSGAVRPGMWARALCINNSLSDGTIFTYLDEIKRRGWAVVVCNPNENVHLPPTAAPRDGLSLDEACEFWLGTSDQEWKRKCLEARRAAIPVAGCENPMAHVATVWDQLVRPAKARAVPIVAHSFGGRCTTSLIETRYAEVERRVPAIAWTDAINTMFKSTQFAPPPDAPPSEVKKWRQLVVERSCNWVASDAPLDTKLRSATGCTEVSAGHDTHEWTSAACCGSVFRFLDAAVARKQ